MTSNKKLRKNPRKLITLNFVPEGGVGLSPLEVKEIKKMLHAIVGEIFLTEPDWNSILFAVTNVLRLLKLDEYHMLLSDHEFRKITKRQYR